MAAGEERRRSALILHRIQRIRRRLNSEVWLRQAVVPLWCAATAVSLHRLLLRDHTWIAALVVFGGAAVWWWLRVRRQHVSVQEAAVMLDRSANAGGLLLTRLELPVGAWELGLNERIRQSPLPEVRRARSIGFGVLALLFLTVALWIPLPKKVAPTINAAAATKVAQVEARAEALAKEVPLEEGLEAELARLREELEDGRFDAADWEAADNVDAALAQKAADAAADLAKAAEAAQALEEAMANAQNGEAASREREALESALMNLGGGDGAQSGAEALEKALAQLGNGEQQQGGQNGDGEQQGQQQGQNGQGQQQGQNGQGQQQGQNGQGQQQGQNGQGQQQGQNGQGQQQAQNGQGQQQAQNGQGQQQGQNGQGQQQGQNGQGQQGGKGPSKTQVSDLKRALQQRQEQLAKSYGQGKGSSGSQTAQNGQSGQGQQGQQGAQCGGNATGNGSGAGSCEGNGGKSGQQQSSQGGVSRGGGPGDLQFQPNEVNPDRLAFSPLPEGNGGDEPGELWGLRAVDPKPGTEPSLGASPSGTVATGEQAPGHDQAALLPRNRELIRRYFDNEQKN